MNVNFEVASNIPAVPFDRARTIKAGDKNVPGLNYEKMAWVEFQVALEKVGLTPEAFFRLCDTKYE